MDFSFAGGILLGWVLLFLVEPRRTDWDKQHPRACVSFVSLLVPRDIGGFFNSQACFPPTVLCSLAYRVSCIDL